MKRSITVVILFAAAVCARAADDAKSAKPAPPQALTIPKDAVRNGNGTYSYTDKQGKKWLYRDTPFGIIRTPGPESGADTRPNSKPATSATKVTDKGDTVQFERSSPFGVTKWEKKKSDLTDEERKLVDAQNQSKPETKTDKPDAK
jgi:hypothetical protein